MIILLGFPKTGTISFQYLFKKLGYKSYHQIYKEGQWISKLMMNQISLERNLLDFIPKDERNITCLTQMDHCLYDKDNNFINFWPQLSHYKELYYQNEDSIFILNKRNTSDLLLSFKNQFCQGISLYDRFIKHNKNLFSKECTDDENMLNLFENHYKNIIEFFTKKKSKFIIYDLNTDNINKIKKYIDIKDIKEFPHKHKTKKI